MTTSTTYLDCQALAAIELDDEFRAWFRGREITDYDHTLDLNDHIKGCKVDGHRPDGSTVHRREIGTPVEVIGYGMTGWTGVVEGHEGVLHVVKFTHNGERVRYLTCEIEPHVCGDDGCALHSGTRAEIRAESLTAEQLNAWTTYIA